MSTFIPRILLAVLLLAVAGCSSDSKSAAPDTGAKAAAKSFFEALGHNDLAAAFGMIEPNGWNAAEFARRVEGYRKNLGFEPSTVFVRACEEHGENATAHVLLRGKGHDRREFKDAIPLRRRDGVWRVVLPNTFGNPLTPPKAPPKKA